ncbi:MULTISPECIES: hypothetical protein [unclassified Roseateles]|uniref:hypothetical protein n=1 Tax=unclassified Roseateles TaxID=2626991 RepID=UPI0012E3BAD4|nr:MULTISPECIES: hypothetical protein [unclassified Roseateles]
MLLLLLAVVFSGAGWASAPAPAAGEPVVSAVADGCQASAAPAERDSPEQAPAAWDADLALTDNAADPQECALPLADMRQTSPVPSVAAEHVRAFMPSLILSRLDRPPRKG